MTDSQVAPPSRIRRKKSAAQTVAVGGAAAVMVSLSSAALYKAVAATATLPLIGRIIRAIEVTVNTSLDFGTLAVTNDIAAAATLDPQSGALRLDGGGGLALAGGSPRAGRIKIRGAAVPVTVTMETNNVHLTNGTTFLTINNFNLLTANGGPQVTITPTGPGNAAIMAIGATLNTRPGQLSGTYVGSNRIFANYQ